jgi:hypothetical protein
MLDRRVHSLETLGKGRTTQTIEAVVRSDDLDNYQLGSSRLRENRFDVFDRDGHIVSCIFDVDA